MSRRSHCSVALKKSSDVKWPDLFAPFLALRPLCTDLGRTAKCNVEWMIFIKVSGFLTEFYLRLFSVLFLFEAVEGRSRDRFIYMVFCMNAQL